MTGAAQRVAEVVPRSRIRRVDLDCAREFGDGVCRIAAIGKKDSQRVAARASRGSMSRTR
jgi:hypothetical protein